MDLVPLAGIMSGESHYNYIKRNFNELNKTILAIACAVLSTTAFAGTADIKASNNQVGVQYISTHVDYTETGNGAVGAAGVTLDTETGSVPGYVLSASVMKDLWLGNDYMQAEYSHNSGSTNYVGSYQGGTYGSVVATSGAVFADYHFRYGKGFVINDKFMATPYVEIGHHRWDRNVGNGAPGGYLEIYTHAYYGVGLLGQYSPMSNLVLSVKSLIGHTFGAEINIPSFGAYGVPTSASLGNSTLYRIGAAADYAFTKQVHGNMGVDYTAFDYGASAWQSGTGGSWAEPDSSTKYTTVKVGIGYAF